MFNKIPQPPLPLLVSSLFQYLPFMVILPTSLPFVSVLPKTSSQFILPFGICYTHTIFIYIPHMKSYLYSTYEVSVCPSPSDKFHSGTYSSLSIARQQSSSFLTTIYIVLHCVHIAQCLYPFISLFLFYLLVEPHRVVLSGYSPGSELRNYPS